MFVEPVPVNRFLVSITSVPGVVRATLLIVVAMFVEPIPVSRVLVSIISVPGVVRTLLLRLMSVPLLLSLPILVFALILAVGLSDCPHRERDRRGQSTRQKKRRQNRFADKHNHFLRVILLWALSALALWSSSEPEKLRGKLRHRDSETYAGSGGGWPDTGFRNGNSALEPITLPLAPSFPLSLIYTYLTMFRPKHLLVLLIVVATVVPFCAQSQPSAPPDSKSVISFLNQTLAWYHHFPVEEQLATEPRDVLFVNEDRQLANQVVRLSFDFARSEAQSLAPTAAAQNADQTDNSIQSRYQSMLAMAAKADQQVKQSQADVDSLKNKLDAATGKRRETLKSAVAEAQSELELAETRRDSMRTMVEFVGSANSGTSGATTLRAQIDELARTVPAATSAASESRTTTANTNASANKQEPTGILGLITDLISLSRKQAALNETIALTEALAQNAKDLRTPLIANLKQAAQQGDQISNQPESTDASVLKQQKAQLDALSSQFKQNSAAVLPLSKQRVLLDLYKNSLISWQDAVKREYATALRNLAFRLAVLGAVLIVVIGFSEIWRRTIYRYVKDVKRRYQFLLLRRIVLWFLIAVIVAFAFATELGSLATFAGLLTAGVAVALQNVILSIAGYFFLIGKRGLRAGDRVQVAGVTGEVVDIGLVRLYLMELGSGGADAQPTGRIVAFSNSVVFQPTGGVFKQIPGTNFVWHEISLTLAPEGNYRAVEERLLSAVESVYTEYRDNIERQRRYLEKTIGAVAANCLGPKSRLHLTKAGLEVVIRYPLELERAAEFDDRITREVLNAIEREPKLKLVGSGTPNIQQVREAFAEKEPA